LSTLNADNVDLCPMISLLSLGIVNNMLINFKSVSLTKGSKLDKLDVR